MPSTPKFLKPHTLAELATLVAGEVKGNAEHVLTGVATLKRAGEHEISFLTNPAYRPMLAETQAGAVIIQADDAPNCPGNAIITKSPHAAYAKIAHLCVDMQPPKGHIARSAVIADSAQVSPEAFIGEHVLIGENTTIGAGAVIDAGCVIGEDVTMGEHCHLYPNVVLYDRVWLGKRVVIHANTVVGSDGFGFAMNEGQWLKVPQLGTVQLHDDVEIGSHTTIDRGAIEDTILHRGVKVDNQVQIGHNVVIGECTVVAGTAAFSGSATIGKYCLIGGGATFAGHITVCDQVQVAGMTTVTRSISKPGVYSSGTGMMPAKEWRKSVVHFRNLDSLAKRIKALEKQSNQPVKEKES